MLGIMSHSHTAGWSFSITRPLSLKTEANVTFERRGKVYLFSISYFICITKHINSMVLPSLRVIYEVNNTMEVLFLQKYITTTSKLFTYDDYESVFHTIRIIEKNLFSSCISVRLIFIPTLRDKISVFPLIIMYIMIKPSFFFSPMQAKMMIFATSPMTTWTENEK